MKKGLPALVFICLACYAQTLAQQSVSIGTTNTNPSAVLWLNSPGNNQALIIPVVNGTSAVANPVAGMVVYDQTTNAMYYRTNSAWEKLGGAVTLTAGTGININGSTITNTGDTNAADDITNSTPATGDLSGTYPSPTVSRIRGVNISATTPTLNQILQYNGTNWTPTTLASGSGTVTSVTGSAPLSVATSTTTPVISMTQANTTTSGFLSSTDFTTFNNKIGTTTTATTDLSGTFGAPTVARIRGVNVSATLPTANQVLQFTGGNWTPTTLTAGTVTSVTGTAPISIATGSTTPVVSMTQANGTTNGFLSSADWTTFNNKIGSGSQAANTVLAAPNGAAGAPTFRTLVANDIPNLDAVKINSGTFPLTRIAGAGAGVRGILGSNNNVLGWVTGAPNQILSTDGAGNLQFVNTSTFGTSTLANGRIFVGNAANVATAVPVSGDLTIDNTGNTQLAAGAIMNADVNAAAAIAGTKITPDFGAQNVLTAGFIGVGNPTPNYPLDMTTGSESYGIHQTDGNVRLSTYIGNGGVEGGAIGTESPHPFFIYTNNEGARLTVQNGTGNVGIGTPIPSTKLEVNGFTKLGSDAPAIRFRKLTGTTSPSSGGIATATLTGIPVSKILSVSVNVQYFVNGFVPANYTANTTYEFQYYYYESGGSTLIDVWTQAGNDANVLNKPYVILVVYEE